MKYYEKQGAFIHFNPVYAWTGLFSKDRLENKYRSNMEYIYQICNNDEKVRKSGVIVSNSFNTTSSTLFICNQELVKEFVLKEDCFEKIASLPVLKDIFGLLLENGERAIKLRSIFSKIFSHEGLEKLTPVICTLIRDKYMLYMSENGISPNEKKRVNLYDVLPEVMNNIGNLLVFGRSDIREEEDISKLSSMVQLQVDQFYELKKNIPFLILPGISMKLGIVSPVNKIRCIMKQQEDILMKYISDRMSNIENHPLGECIMDRIIQHNMECKSKGDTYNSLSPSDIVSNFNLFQFAGTDTSQNTSMMVLSHMCDDKAHQQIVSSINSNIYNEEGITHNEDIYSDKQVSAWVKECFRLYTPVSRTTFRRATRDITLGNIRIRKNDIVNIMICALNYNKEIYDDMYKFDIGRFNDTSIHRYNYIPFSVGKRVA